MDTICMLSFIYPNSGLSLSIDAELLEITVLPYPIGMLNNMYTNVGDKKRLSAITIKDNNSLKDLFIKQPMMKKPEIVNKLVLISVDDNRGMIYVDFKFPINTNLIDSIDTYGGYIRSKMVDSEVGWTGTVV